jgi:hypothetical protein
MTIEASATFNTDLDHDLLGNKRNTSDLHNHACLRMELDSDSLGRDIRRPVSLLQLLVNNPIRNSVDRINNRTANPKN